MQAITANFIALAQTGENVDPAEIVDGSALQGCSGGGFVCARILDWTGNETLADIVAWAVDRPLKILLILAAAWVLNRLARRGIARLVRHAQAGSSRLGTLKRESDTMPTGRARADQRGDALTSVFRSVATIVIWSIASLLVLGELGINLGPLLAGAGIIGIAFGFGAQSLVKDFLSGIFMLVEDQYGIGDIVDTGKAAGTVEKITLRETVIREVNGTVWHIPNGQIEAVGNKSQHWSRALLDIGVAHETDLRHAQQIIKEVADGTWRDTKWDEHIHAEPEVWGVQALGADGCVLRLVVQTAPASQWAVERELRLRIKEAFDAEGIMIPSTQPTVLLTRDVAVDLPTSESAAKIQAPVDATSAGTE